jgi:Right handed beta helix region
MSRLHLRVIPRREDGRGSPLMQHAPHAPAGDPSTSLGRTRVAFCLAPLVAVCLAFCATTAVQQDERRSEAQLLPVEPEVSLDGAPFPPIERHETRFPAPRRTFHAGAAAAVPGDGSAERPWTDLQAALCRLEPGDRLVVAPGQYTGPFRIAGSCRDGTPDAPIQLFAQDAFLRPGTAGDVLTVERAHWQLWHVQLTLSSAAGLVLAGPGAHHVAVDRSHISEGDGAAVRITGGASDIAVTNSHIHHSGGIRVEAGAARIQLLNNHIHHNRASGIGVGEAREITIAGNRIHNDNGPAVDVTGGAGIAIAGNRLWNCSPSAIRLAGGAHDVAVEHNAVVEATTAVDAAGAERVALRRNYFENRLTGGSTALLLGRARQIRFHNNVVNRYTTPLRAAGSDASQVTVANNLFAGAAGGWSPAPPAVFSFVGHNAVAGEALERRELGTIPGIRTVDAGKAMDGEPFRGSAPDIGVAER